MSDYTPKSRNTLPIIFDDRMHVNNLIPKIVNRVNDNTEDLTNLYEETEAMQEDVAGKIDAPETAGTAGQVLTTDGTGGTAWTTVGSGEIVVDPTLSIQGAAADAKKTGDEITHVKQDISELESAKISKPATNPDGTNGQLLRTNGDGTTTWVDQGLPTDEQTAEAVSAWLDRHSDIIQNYVTPEMFGAVGNGVTDDSAAVQAACDAAYAVYFGSNKTYYLASTVTIDHDCYLFGGENSVIKTKTPSGGTAPNAIVVQGTLKKTTTLTSDYTTSGSDNVGNQLTLSDMTGISIGDIIVIVATDQYYSKARQYYYLGATVQVVDIYNGHVYIGTSIPWDIANTENVTVSVYDAPTAIFDNLRFVSDLDSRGSYKYAITLLHTKNSIIRNCNTYECDNGIIIYESTNALIDCVSMAKSKYDNALPADGYGIALYGCTNTVIKRVIAMCGQHALTTGGDVPVIDLYVKECELNSECRPVAIGCHENTYHMVVEDSVIAGAGMEGVCELNRCRLIRGIRGGASLPAVSMGGSYNPKFASLRMTNCIIDPGCYVYIRSESPQTPISAYDSVLDSVEIENCTGGYMIFQLNALNADILSFTVNKMVIRNWIDCTYIRTYNRGAKIKYLELVDCQFLQESIYIRGNDEFDTTDILCLRRISSNPKYEHLFVTGQNYGNEFSLPENVKIRFNSQDQTKHYGVCGNNVFPNVLSDCYVGMLTGRVGDTLSRTHDDSTSAFANSLSVDANGNLVFTQPTNASQNRYIYPVCLIYNNKLQKAIISCKLKNTGSTNPAGFRAYFFVIDVATGKIIQRQSSSIFTASADGTEVQFSYDTQPKNTLIQFALYCVTTVNDSETTFENLVARVMPVQFADDFSFEKYEGTSRTGDGTLYSVNGVNNIMADPGDFTFTFKADLPVM